jgi:hypothetical protein
MKKFLYFLITINSIFLYGQSDTIVVSDYTKVMVTTNMKKGGVSPITNFDGLTQAGFFLHNLPQGKIRICNDEKISIWVNGKLAMNLVGCKLVDPEQLYSNTQTDTLFVSFTTNRKFANFRCELVQFEKLQVIKENLLLARSTRNSFTEFTIISLITILIFLGILIGYYPSRMGYILEKTFTFKTNAYEFINTNFLGAPSLCASGLLSLILGFLSVYLNELLDLNVFDRNQNAIEFIWSWLKLSFLIFAILFLKRFLIDILSGLFQFKGLKNYQMFDFINFNLFFFIPVTALLALDFNFFASVNSWVSLNFLLTFPFVLILFQVWFALKFVNHSPRRKLIIISYLCATEIIPAIFLLSWFFK